MKRDIDLIRQILLEIEQNDQPHRSIEIEAEGYTSEQISHHVWLLTNGGYVEAVSRSTLVAEVWHPKCLTWEGHEFLDAMRNKTVWNQVKAKLKDAAATAPLSVIQKLATAYVSQHLGLGQ